MSMPYSSIRIPEGMRLGQAESARKIAAYVGAYKYPINQWEYVAGQDYMMPASFFPVAGDQRDLDYYSYRGFASMCLLSNDHIIRVRNGDPADNTDRQIWYQEITDPTDAAQWESWSVLYSGTHYQVSVAADGTSYVVYHSKSDGLYKNNVLILPNAGKTAPNGDAFGKVLNFVPIEGSPYAGWLYVLHTDPFLTTQRTFNYYFVPDTRDTSDSGYPVYYWDPNNYRWLRPGLAAALSGSTVYRVQSGPMYQNPRAANNGIALWVNTQADAADDSGLNAISVPRAFYGIGGGAGYNTVGAQRLFYFDGYYYLYFYEVHQQNPVTGDPGYATNLGSVPVWMRSTDGYNWTEPMVGPGFENSYGFAGVVHLNGYFYWADNGAVWRRPDDTAYDFIDVSNYTTEGEFESPVGSDTSTGTLAVANPDGVNQELITDYSDAELILQLGMEYTDPDSGLKVYSFDGGMGQFGQFFIKRCTEERDGAISRIKVEFTDFWGPLEKPFKDTINIVGKTEIADLQANGTNQLYNYYFVTDTAPSIDSTTYYLNCISAVVATSWRGHNFDFEASFSPVTTWSQYPGIIFRFVDQDNYMKFQRTAADTLKLYEVVDGVGTVIDTYSISAVLGSTPGTGTDFTLKVVARWSKLQLYINDTLVDTVTREWETISPGYIGITTPNRCEVYDWNFSDWETDLQISDLIKMILAFRPEFDRINGGPFTEQTWGKAYALAWGPQTDVPTPAEALRQLMQASKLEYAWRYGDLWFGTATDTNNSSLYARDLATLLFTFRNEVIESTVEDTGKDRINYAIVNGNEHFWIQIDIADLHRRSLQNIASFDLPELLDLASVQARASQEIRDSYSAEAPTAKLPFQYDVYKLDLVEIIDNDGVAREGRVLGATFEFNQGKAPFQRLTLITGKPSTLRIRPSSIASAAAVGSPTL